MTDLLIQGIKNKYSISQKEIDEFQGYLSKKFVRKGDHFLNLNQVSRHIAFIDSGLSMNYSLHDGIEIPRYFALEGDWIGSIKSFSTGSPSELAIKALEDTWIREISAEQMQQLFTSSPRWLIFYNQIVQGVFWLMKVLH
jgi:hypothetical protein